MQATVAHLSLPYKKQFDKIEAVKERSQSDTLLPKGGDEVPLLFDKLGFWLLDWRLGIFEPLLHVLYLGARRARNFVHLALTDDELIYYGEHEVLSIEGIAYGKS